MLKKQTMKAKNVAWGEQAPSARVSSERAVSGIRAGSRGKDVQDKTDKRVSHHKETAAYVAALIAKPKGGR